MRRLLVILSFFASFSLQAAEGSAVLMAKGIQLLQEGRKPEALKFLEQAFQGSNDPNELRVIGALILEASPLDYPKRDAYLRYLVKFAPDHADYPKWLKELGDRALNVGQLDQAEDWYLRAMVFYKNEDKPKIQYQLAWVYWNKKQKEKALFSFFEIYQNSPMFREDLRTDMLRLWWELEKLPTEIKEIFLKLPKEHQKLLLIEWVSQSTKQKGEAHIRTSLEDVAQIEAARPILIEQVQSGWKIEALPCLFFESLLRPQDSYPAELLLQCLKSKNHPPTSQLLPFFETWSGERSEAFDWAQAEALVENGQKVQAAELIMQSLARGERSPAFYDFAEKLLLSLSEEEFRSFEETHSIEFFEVLLRQRPQSLVLQSLQSVDPKTWIYFQENHLASSVDKKFWLKKALWQSHQANLDVKDLRVSLEKIWSYDLDKADKTVRDELQNLHRRSETELPTLFGEDFKKEYDRWLADLDRSIKEIQKSGAEWNRISLPFLQAELRRNIDALKSRIDLLELPPELQELSASFGQKKEELKMDLENKYRALLETKL